MKIKTLRPVFVDHLPEHLDEGVLYISEEFAIAGHKCCCGCGEEVITPLNHAQWKIRKGKGAISLHPSIGNLKYACKSHYWIRKNQVIDASPMDEETIELVKQCDRKAKDRYIKECNKPRISSSEKMKADRTSTSMVDEIIKWLRNWWNG